MDYESPPPPHLLLLSFLLTVVLPAAPLPLSYGSVAVFPGWTSIATEPNTPSSGQNSYVSEILSTPSYTTGPKGFTFAFLLEDNSLFLSVCIGRKYVMAVPVWIAEVSLPVGADGFLTVDSSSNLVLKASDGSVAWGAPAVAGLEMADSGNLRMFDKNGVATWESFRNPTDVVLQNQPVSSGLQFKSRRAHPSDLLYSAEMQDGGMVLFVNLPEKYPYWAITSAWASWAEGFASHNVSSVSQLPPSCGGGGGGVVCGLLGTEFSFHSACSSLSFRFGRQKPAPDFLRLDGDGRWRAYTYVGNETSGTISPIAALDHLAILVESGNARGNFRQGRGGLGTCDVPNACGPYGVCTPGSYPLCSCPSDFGPGGHSVNPEGCALPATQDERFVRVAGATFVSMLFTSWRNITLNSDDCIQLCKSQLLCELAFYNHNTSFCLLLNRAMSLLQLNDSAYSAFVRIRVPNTGGGDSTGGALKPYPLVNPSHGSAPSLPPSISPSFLPSSPPSSGDPARLPSIYPTHSQASNSRTKNLIIILVSASLLTTVLAVVANFASSRLFGNGSNPKGDAEADEECIVQSLTRLPRRFSYKIMEAATEGFKKKLGSGGFGSVYEGFLPDGRRIAVKKLEATVRGQKPFLAEVAIIGALSHINVVRLVGFSIERENRLLVYEYMEGGSLDRWLFSEGGQVLDWKTRFKIVVGAAHGLAYLHDECTEPILHLDIKPQNILLDGEFVAKLSDFGLSKVIDKRSSFVTGVRGTPGYIAPEWLLWANVTKKCDVYSFGMVLLEVIGGRRNVLVMSRSRVTAAGEYEPQFFPAWVVQKMEEGRVMEVVDERVAMAMAVTDEAEALRVMRVALWCVQEDPNMRPSMKQVVYMLEGSTHVPDPPLHSTVAWQISKFGALQRRGYTSPHEDNSHVQVGALANK